MKITTYYRIVGMVDINKFLSVITLRKKNTKYRYWPGTIVHIIVHVLIHLHLNEWCVCTNLTVPPLVTDGF